MYQAYVLFSAKEDSLEIISQILATQAGVIMVDILEEQPEVMVVIQARTHRKLAEVTVKAISAVENLTEGMRLMPVKDISRYKANKSGILTYNN